jgi:hypothetical protein
VEEVGTQREGKLRALLRLGEGIYTAGAMRKLDDFKVMNEGVLRLRRPFSEASRHL